METFTVPLLQTGKPDMNTEDSPNMLAAAASRGFSFFAGLGLRLLVHFSSLVAAGIAAASLDIPGRAWVNSAAVVVTAYIGLVCLLPRGMGRTASWLIPTGLGFFQCLVWSYLGVPWLFHRSRPHRPGQPAVLDHSNPGPGGLGRFAAARPPDL